jgi:hypothetical protein
MKYNYEVRTQLTDEELSDLVSNAAEGLEGSSQLILELKLNVNTELPNENVDALTEAVSQLVSDKLGVEVEAQLISKEY